MEKNKHSLRIIAIVNVLIGQYTDELEKVIRTELDENELNFIKGMTVDDAVDFIESLTLTDELKSDPEFTSNLSTLLMKIYQIKGDSHYRYFEQSQDMLVQSARNKSPRSLFILGNNQFLEGNSEKGLENIILSKSLGYGDAFIHLEVYRWHMKISEAFHEDYYRLDDYNYDTLTKGLVEGIDSICSFDIETIERIEDVIIKTTDSYKKAKYIYGIFRSLGVDISGIKVSNLSLQDFLKSIQGNSYTIIDKVLSRDTQTGYEFLINEPARLEKAINDIDVCLELASKDSGKMHSC